MALTALQAASTDTTPAVKASGMTTNPNCTSGNSPPEENLKSLWTALCVAEKQREKRGLQFGQALYEYREKSEVVQGGTTFRGTLDKLGIPHSTAYFWIARYEESMGTRPIKPAVTTPVSVELEPEPEPETVSTPTSEVLTETVTEASAVTEVPTVSKADQDRESLRNLAHRMESLTKAVQQILDDKDRWSQHEKEYDDVASLGKTLGKMVEQL